MTAASRRTLLQFGLIADLQYANIDDGFNFDKTKKRYYRNAISLLRTAMKDWKHHNIRFVLQLGDIIDGFCRRVEEPETCLNRILDIFGEESWPLFNVIGNHELYNFKKDKLYTSRLFNTLQRTNKAYHSTELFPGLKLCALNTYDISILGAVEGTSEYEKAHKFLLQNPNIDKNDPSGLISTQRRLVGFNGGVSEEQQEWLKKELASAVQQQQNVIVIGHNPVFGEATDDVCLCWNYQEVLEIIDNFQSCVVCYISGHDHDGGYAVDNNGIHHVTMLGAIEHPDAYAVGYLLEDSLLIEGKGDMLSVTCPLRFKLQS